MVDHNQIEKAKKVERGDIEQSAVERSRTIVLKMHAKQIPTDVIAQFTGIPFEDVQRITETN